MAPPQKPSRRRRPPAHAAAADSLSVDPAERNTEPPVLPAEALSDPPAETLSASRGDVPLPPVITAGPPPGPVEGGEDDLLPDVVGEDEVPASDDDVAVKRTDPQDDGRTRLQLSIRRRLPGRRLDKYLHGRFQKLSRTMIQKMIKQGDILVNGLPTKNSYEMEGGDRIDIAMPPPEPYDVTPEDIPLDIVYEDDHLLAVNKPVGMIVHPATRTQGGTVANALAFYCTSLAKTDDPFRPGIVHRLDKNTSGIMVVAKTDEAHWRLSMQFEERKTEKIYVAIVHGTPEFDEDIIDVPIGQHPTVHDRYVATGFAERMGGKFEKKLTKEAVTRYRVMERFRNFSFVHLFPKTGRTHQLRIHMSHIRHPMVGDPFYGGRHVSVRDVTGRPEDPAEPRWTRQMLHAHRLIVTHPITRTPLELVAPIPADMTALLELLRASATPRSPRLGGPRR